jgi:uncharacterized membrane protein
MTTIEAAEILTAGQKFSTGRVIGRTFSAVSSNALIVWPIALVFVAIPGAAVAYFMRGQEGQFGSLLRSAVVGLFAIFVQGVVIKACLMQFAGKSRRFGASFSAGVTHYAGMFGVRFLTTWGVVLGLVLVIIPGLIWATSWVVAAPALVAEDLGSHGPLARSAKLTKGSRWPILGLILIFVLAYFVLTLIAGVALGLLWRWIAPLAPSFPTVGPFAEVSVTPLALMAYEVFVAAGAASIYWELKLVRENGGAEAVSRVFA